MMLRDFLLRLTFIFPLLLLFPLCRTKPYAAGPPNLALIDPAEKNASFWRNEAQQFLDSRIERWGEDEGGVANNVIMFYGDGMGPSTLTAARWYKGQVTGTPRPQLAWETWPGMSLARVFCVDSMVADSGCSATAYSSGVKGNFFSMGVSGFVKDCQQQLQEAANQDVTSILQWAMEEGRSTGIVTTTDITDASPSAFYAHIASRSWKNDYLVPVEGCPDIAMQMIRSHPGRDINVLLGRGSKNFIPSSQGGFRMKDDLIEEWKTRRSQGSQADNYVFINKSAEVQNVDTEKTDFLLGLFEQKDKPDLKAMTKTAIEILSKNPKGFFLFVENEEIDNTNHDNLAGGALEEVLNLEEAVNTALNMTANNNDNMNENNTLILVSADHAHTLTISGYPQRGQDILGSIWKDGPSILNYASGPGALSPSDPSANVSSSSRLYPSLHPASNSWHGGDDIAVYARGPGSKMFWGNMDQTLIPNLLAYSACIGPGRRHASCGRKGTPSCGIVNGVERNVGDTWTDDCNSCVCRETGIATCTKRFCLKAPIISPPTDIMPCLGCPQESEIDDDITSAAAHATASLAGISDSGCGEIRLVKVENARRQVVAGTNFFLTLRLETREGQGCAHKTEKICQNIAVFKPLPFACQSDDGCLELTNQEGISCKPADLGTTLLSLDPSVDTSLLSLISQCSGPEKSNCRAVHVNQEVLNGLTAEDTVHLLASSPVVLTLRQLRTYNRSGSRSFIFRLGRWGEATITVGTNWSMFGSIKPDEGSVDYTIESCGNGCNVIYEIEKGHFNQFYD